MRKYICLYILYTIKPISLCKGVCNVSMYGCEVLRPDLSNISGTLIEAQKLLLENQM